MTHTSDRDQELGSPPGSVEGSGVRLEEVDTSRRDADDLLQVALETNNCAKLGGELDLSERDAIAALAERALLLHERLQAIIDWADFALSNPQLYDSHGVRNLDGPVFDEARDALAKATGR